MKKSIIFIISLIFSYALFAQEINIRGHVYDYHSQKVINGVVFSCKPGEILDISSESGGFHITTLLDKIDTIKLLHSDYYPAYIKLNNSYRFKIQSFFMISKKLELDTIFYLLYEENKQLNGEVFDGNSLRPLAGAVVKMPNGQRIAYSNINGQMLFGIPKNTTQINILHPGFEPQTIKLKQKRKHESFNIKLKKNNFSKEDTLWRSYKYLIEFIPNELISRSIGIRYHKILWHNHSIGLQTSLYVNGRLYALNVSDSEFDGLKIAPIYRYYLNRNMKNLFFLELKFIGGYFNFYDLYYGSKADPRRGEHFSEKFWSFGFGTGMGYTFVVKKSKHIVMGFSASYQYLPMKVPEVQFSDHYGKVYPENYNWYFGGPGSTVEIKIIIGGIF